MSLVEERLQAMGLQIPEVVAPLAAYVPAIVSGRMIYVSGQLPMVKGELVAQGRVGAEIDQEQAVALARVCALNGMAAAASVIGDLDRVVQVVKVVGFVACTPEFHQQPAVVNGASELLGAVFGGAHARSAVGVTALPRNAPVEVEMILEVAD